MQWLQRRRCFLVQLGLVGAVALAAAMYAPNSMAADGSDIASHRTRLDLPEKPDRAMNVLAVLEQLKAESKRGAASIEIVTVVGQIGGMPNPWTETHPDFPWFAGQASFFLLDKKVAAQFAHHAQNHGGNHQCAFCKSLAAKNAHAAAVVNLVDEQGKILKIDARDLLDLREGQTVTIRGRAELLGGTMLVLHADGIHLGGPRIARKPAR